MDAVRCLNGFIVANKIATHSLWMVTFMNKWNIGRETIYIVPCQFSQFRQQINYDLIEGEKSNDFQAHESY